MGQPLDRVGGTWPRGFVAAKRKQPFFWNTDWVVGRGWSWVGLGECVAATISDSVLIAASDRRTTRTYSCC